MPVCSGILPPPPPCPVIPSPTSIEALRKTKPLSYMVARSWRLEYDVRISLGQVQDGLGEDAIGPGEPAPRVRHDVVHIHAIVDKAQPRCFQDVVETLPDLRVVVRRPRLHQQPQGPGVGEANVRTCERIIRPWRGFKHAQRCPR